MLSRVFLGSSAGFSYNPVSDLHQILAFEFMRNAYLAGTIASVLAGVVGYFVILRHSSFAAHALSHIGFAGATGAVVVGVNPVLGLLTFCLGAGAVMGGLGQRLRASDTVIGIVLAWTLGLGVLFLSLYTGYATEAYALLFGEILGISPGDVLVTLIASAVALVAIATLYRPLLFASVDEEVAEARGAPVRLLSVAFMMVLALAVSAAVQVVGVLIIFALIVIPAAIAERLTRRPASAILLSVLLSVGFTWSGLTIAYYQPYPVSFFIVSSAFFVYLVVRFMPQRARAKGGAVPALALSEQSGA